MKPVFALVVCCALFALVALAQRPRGGRIWAQYEDEMQDPVEDPPDTGRKGEFVQGRLRYRSPLGPLRFDIGFKLDRRDFSRGTERRAVYHLSLGQAF